MVMLEKGKAMQCFGRMVELIEKDPDHGTQAKLQAEYNCRVCDSYPFCRQLADILG